MKTIAITVDDGTLKLLQELAAANPGGTRSALVRAALRDYAHRELRRVVETRDASIFRKHRKQLMREARGLVRDQARP